MVVTVLWPSCKCGHCSVARDVHIFTYLGRVEQSLLCLTLILFLILLFKKLKKFTIPEFFSFPHQEFLWMPVQAALQ